MLPYKSFPNLRSKKDFHGKGFRKKWFKTRFWNVSPVIEKSNFSKKVRLSLDVKKKEQKSLNSIEKNKSTSSVLKTADKFDNYKAVSSNFTDGQKNMCNTTNKKAIFNLENKSEPSSSFPRKKVSSQTSLKKLHLCDMFNPSTSTEVLSPTLKSSISAKMKSPQLHADDEDVIVIPNNKKDVCLSTPDLQRCVKNIVNNIMINETDLSTQFSPAKIASRMKYLYHQDFSHRLKEIEECVTRAKRRRFSNPGHMQEVRPGLRLIDLNTLNPGEWLNDVIINTYIALLINAKPWLSCVSSFFFEALQRHGKQTLPEDWFEKQSVFVPMCIGSHWSLLRASPNEHVVEVYNSLLTTAEESKCIKVIKNYLQLQYNESTNEKSNWIVKHMKNISHQQNAYDCGVYVCLFARRITFNQPLKISPLSASHFRGLIKKELTANRIFLKPAN